MTYQEAIKKLRSKMILSQIEFAEKLGVIIGTGSIVTKDIPVNVIAVGNLCKVIREITDKDKTGYTR